MSKLKQIDQFIEKILNESLEDVVSERFARYSKYIIQDRALPDARDGLKPVQRRILYAMHQLGMFHNKPYKKSARIAGEVMGKYHPHGDLSIYDAMVRLSQDFKMRLPLIDMHGNNGSIDGDTAAAMRYTEARLSKAAESLLLDIEKHTVPFVPNFDDEELEPTVLPTKFPNLLVNGASGISAGYATKIPPHNLIEVVEAALLYLDHEDISIDELIKVVKGPDFPTGGIVQGKEGIYQALSTGSGKVVLRSKTEIEEISKSQDRIVITEIPYEINKSELVAKIDELRIDKKVEDILEVRDETDQEGLRIAIDLKKGSNAPFILNYLFKNTNLQVAYNYNMVAILNHRPVLVGILPILKAYIDHQKEVITNRSNFELEKAKKRKHIVDGLIKMVSIVEQVIETIRKSTNKASSKENIMVRFGFTELQAEAIVTLQLYRLSSTDIEALQKENQELDSKIRDLEHILTNEKALKNVIKKELKNAQETLGTPRKTVIEDEIETIKIDQTQLISDERVMVGITKDGYVKRASFRSYQASTSVGLKQDDALLFEQEVSTLDTLLMFTNKGQYIYLPVYKIDDQKWKDLGIYINNIVEIDKDESLIKVISVSSFDKEEMLLFATKKGMMKQVNLKELEVTRYSKALRAMRLAEDEVVSVDRVQKNNIIVVSKLGYVLRFKTDELPSYGLQAGGVKSMAIGDDDEVAEAFYAKNTDEIVLLTVRGHVIKDYVPELPVYNRNRKGVRLIDQPKANPHYIVSAQRLSKEQIKENASVYILSSKELLKVNVSDLKYTANKYGKKMFDESKGNGYRLLIEAVFEKEDFESDYIPKVKKNVSKSNELELVEEEVVTKNNKKIRISRLDLFEDD